MRILIASLTTLVITAAPAWADDPKPMEKPAAAKADDKASKEQAAMMEAFKKAGTPGAPHEALAKRAGNYTAVMKSYSPTGEATESNGRSTFETMFGGRFLKQTFTGEHAGQTFTGLGILGYDNLKKKYVVTWTDSMTTATTVLEGTADASGKITLTGECLDPVSGKPVKHRMVTRMDGNDTIVEEMYASPKGKEVKMMEITYTRAKNNS